MSDYVPYNISTDAGKALWRKANETSGSSTWGPLGRAIEAIELEAKADAWDEGDNAGSENQLNWDGWRYTKPEMKNPYRGDPNE